ncbi:MAG: prolyl 4-hydroxylase [Flavobacteriales bacterium]|jgi:prolyl 4-hydroxylase
MNNEWLEWTRSNLERGCAADEVREILKKNNFSSTEIDEAMNIAKPGFFGRIKQKVQAKSRELESSNRDVERSRINIHDFDYQRMSEPRITRNNDAILYSDERIQLYTLDNFLTLAECEKMIAVINANLRPSTITSGRDSSNFRTSSTCDMGLCNDRFVDKVDKQISRTLGLRLPWSETIQGQKYQVGQEFKAHTDFFEPHTPEFEKFAAAEGQRTWTFMVYLNSTPKGGATRFTALEKEFKPKPGQAVIWNSLLPSGEPNDNTIHHGMPVEEGEKIIITKWFRDKGKGTPYLSK